MSRLPAVTALALERVLLKLGFEETRRKGSHVFYRHADGRTTTVPHHRGRVIAWPLLREILREIEVTSEQFQSQLRRK